MDQSNVMKENFVKEIQSKYTFKGESLTLGKGMFEKEVQPEANVALPLKMFNRHGLIAGATGTGKTKTLQVIVEGLSNAGVPSLVMDIKGDLSGLAEPGDQNNRHISERHQKLQIPYEATGFPVELLTLSDEKGVRLRATVSEFGPVLFSKILDLNDTQSDIMAIVFKYCDDKGLPLVDLKDVRKVLQYVSEDPSGKAELKRDYGSIATASLSAILRSIVALEQQGADQFFGELSFDPEDLLEKRGGKGVVNILRVTDIQDKPNLFSTFMLGLLAEIYNTFPEQGDSDRPKLVLFIDEAHLIFREASKALLQQIETVVKLIRSKGIGIFFITQVPGDVPEEILSQLGTKVQHALRGFTAKDKKEIDKAVENYPISEFYDASRVIQELGIGEAFITGLNEKGIPTPLVHTYLRAPQSRMDVLTEKEIDKIVSRSELVDIYGREVDKETAYELLLQKMERVEAIDTAEPRVSGRTQDDNEPSMLETLMTSSAGKQLQRTIVREGTKLLFSMLGASGGSRRKN